MCCSQVLGGRWERRAKWRREQTCSIRLTTRLAFKILSSFINLTNFSNRGKRKCVDESFPPPKLVVLARRSCCGFWVVSEMVLRWSSLAA